MSRASRATIEDGSWHEVGAGSLDPFDVIVVGGGSAGCVLASRLSEDHRRKVLLLEAGRDLPPGKEPDWVLSRFPAAYGDPRLMWPSMRANKVWPSPGGAGVPLPQGRGIGGSSTVMGLFATRGLASDFDEWARSGATGWSWREVLPYFRKIERDLDFGAQPEHGSQGPITVRRTAESDWPLFAKRLAAEARAWGAAPLLDLNDGSETDGLGPAPMNVTATRRSFAAADYLTRDVRRRANLTVMCGSEVRRIILRDGRAIGAETWIAGRQRRFMGREVVLACGALQSPALLLRSGIGHPARLAELGIACAAENPGVGQGLQHHPSVRLATYLPPHARQSDRLPTMATWGWRFSSGLADCPAGDMFIWPINRTAWHALGRRVGALGVVVNRSFSLGRVDIHPRSQDAAVTLGLLSDPRDGARLSMGLTMILQLLGSKQVADVRGRVFWPDEALAAKLNAPGRRNAALAQALALALDAVPALRGIATGRAAPTTLTPEGLEALVSTKALATPHFSASCRMGSPADPATVVDARCRVRGALGLRVADASVMPHAPRGGTHLAVLMVAEKTAAMMVEDGA